MSSRKKTSTKPPAAKQAEEEVVKVKEELPKSNVLWKIARAAGLLFIAGVASTVSQLNLSPVYGAIPSSLHHQRTMTITAVAALAGHQGLKRYISTDLAQYIGVIAYWTPVIQYFAFQYSGKLGVEYGPLIIESLTYFPFLFLTMYASADLLDAIDHSQSGFPEIVGQMLVPTASYFFVEIRCLSAAAIHRYIRLLLTSRLAITYRLCVRISLAITRYRLCFPSNPTYAVGKSTLRIRTRLSTRKQHSLCKRELHYPRASGIHNWLPFRRREQRRQRVPPTALRSLATWRRMDRYSRSLQQRPAPA
jgi:hypothetical protein